MSFPFNDLGPCLVDTFASPAPVVRLRRGHTALDANGFIVTVAPSRVTIKAVVYPATGRDMEVLPEGKRGEETIHVISTADLRTAVPGSYPSDQIEYQGKTYEVSMFKDWNANARFYSVLATRVNVPLSEV